MKETKNNKDNVILYIIAGALLVIVVFWSFNSYFANQMLNNNFKNTAGEAITKPLTTTNAIPSREEFDRAKSYVLSNTYEQLPPVYQSRISKVTYDKEKLKAGTLTYEQFISESSQRNTNPGCQYSDALTDYQIEKLKSFFGKDRIYTKEESALLNKYIEEGKIKLGEASKGSFIDQDGTLKIFSYRDIYVQEGSGGEYRVVGDGYICLGGGSCHFGCSCVCSNDGHGCSNYCSPWIPLWYCSLSGSCGCVSVHIGDLSLPWDGGHWE